jgi:hypothetical protein
LSVLEEELLVEGQPEVHAPAEAIGDARGHRGEVVAATR